MENFEQRVDIERLREKLIEIYDDDDKYQKLYKFAQGLKAKYKDYDDYRLYHLLIGSTPPEEGLTKIDFQGDDSVEKFIYSF